MRVFLCCVLICASLSPAFAQSQAPGQIERLTLDEAIKEALDHNLNLIAQRYDISIADARIITASLRPNPVLSLGMIYQDVFGVGFASNPTAAAGPPEGNARVDYLFERGQKRQRRVDLATAAKSVTQLLVTEAVRQLRYSVESAYVDALLASESLAVARESQGMLNNIVTINEARVKAGDLAQVELLRTRLAAIQFGNVVRQGELRVQVATNNLKLLLGRPADSPPVEVVGPLRRQELSEGIPDLQTIAQNNRPDLLALRRDQARTVADLRLQLAQAKVDYTVGLQYNRQYAFAGGPQANGSAMSFYFGTPIPLFNRNQGEIERARIEQNQAEARVRAMELNVNSQVQNAYRQYETAMALLQTLERDMVQQARQVRDTMDYSYRRGEATFVEFLDAQRAFNETMQSYNEARAEFARSLYLVDSVSGKSVNP